MSSAEVAAAVGGTIKPKEVARILRNTDPKTGLLVDAKRRGPSFEHSDDIAKSVLSFQLQTTL